MRLPRTDANRRVRIRREALVVDHPHADVVDARALEAVAQARVLAVRPSHGAVAVEVERVAHDLAVGILRAARVERHALAHPRPLRRLQASPRAPVQWDEGLELHGTVEARVDGGEVHGADDVRAGLERTALSLHLSSLLV